MLRQHFHLLCKHAEWNWSGEILIPAAGAANAPHLFDCKYGLIKQAGAELARGAISGETTQAIVAPVMPAEEYRRMATAYFEGGLLGKAKAVGLAMKAMLRGKREGD